MAVDSIQRIPNYQIAESNEANEEERRREKDKNRNQKKFGIDLKKTEAKLPSEKSSPSDPETDLLQTQPVDSQKVVELLSHCAAPNPAASIAKIRMISQIQSAKKSDQGEPKKINKSA